MFITKLQYKKDIDTGQSQQVRNLTITLELTLKIVIHWIYEEKFITLGLLGS